MKRMSDILSLEEIKSTNGKETIAIIVRKEFSKDGLNFLSKSEYPLQLGVNSYSKGVKINPHVHVNREIVVTSIQEMVYIKSGKVTIHLFGQNKEPLGSYDLLSGDLVFLVSGGHGFDILDDTTIIEVKQGPYSGKTLDKVMI
jgi:hypothetical protein